LADGTGIDADNFFAVDVAGVRALGVFIEELTAEQVLTRTKSDRVGGAVGRFHDPLKMVAFLEGRTDMITHIAFDLSPEGRVREPFPAAECVAAFRAAAA
jgi:hypothetical protein